jgi:hypothetical protein
MPDSTQNKDRIFLEDPRIDEPIDNLLWCVMDPAHVHSQWRYLIV